MEPHTAAPESTNTSALVSAAACVLAIVFELLALSTGGQLRQLFELVAILLALSGIGLGFSAVTVARFGAPRLALSIIAMVGNIVVLIVVCVLPFVG